MATPQINRANVAKANAPMVMKTNTLAKHLMTPATGNQGMSFSKFVRENNLNENRLSKTVPLSLTDNQIAASKIAFMDVFEWDYDASDNIVVEAAMPSFIGGRIIGFTADGEEGVYNTDGMYYDFANPIVVNKTKQTAKIVTHVPIATLNHNGVGRTRIDTVETVYIINEEWFTEDADPADIMGTIQNDGSMSFERGWAYLFEYELMYYSNGNLQWTETTYSISSIFRNTCLMVPTGTHSFSYVNEETGSEVNTSVPVYMYQDNDSTVHVWNLWGLGNRDNQMILYSDGTMRFPFQFITEDDMSEYTAANPERDYSTSFYNYNGDASSVVDDSDTYGQVSGNSITWGNNTVSNYYVYNNQYYFPAVSYATFYNNVLNLDNGQFVIPTDPGQYLRGDVNDDGNVSISDVTTLIDYLLNGDATGVNLLAADCNEDESITISDVTTLIDYLLNGQW